MSPTYLWHGPGDTSQVELDRAVAPRTTRPTAPSEADELSPRWVCKVDGCGRKFKKAMIAARHFNQSHEDLKDDKDSWRGWVEETLE